MPQFIKEAMHSDPSKIKYKIKQSQIPVPGSLHPVKKFVEIYLHETKGVQNFFEVGRNMMTFEIIKVIKFMLNHGFYQNLEELKGIAIPMISLLNGANDIYNEQQLKSTTNTEDDGKIMRTRKDVNNDIEQDEENVDFSNIKRYFSSGTNDIIVQCKAIICENLLIISQLEVDGKAQLFLSKFKSDLDMLMLQKQMKFANPEEDILATSNNGQEVEKMHKKKGFFQSMKLALGKVNIEKPQPVTFKQVEN